MWVGPFIFSLPSDLGNKQKTRFLLFLIPPHLRHLVSLLQSSLKWCCWITWLPPLGWDLLTLESFKGQRSFTQTFGPRRNFKMSFRSTGASVTILPQYLCPKIRYEYTLSLVSENSASSLNFEVLIWNLVFLTYIQLTMVMNPVGIIRASAFVF